MWSFYEAYALAVTSPAQVVPESAHKKVAQAVRQLLATSPDSVATYLLVVTFEIVGQEIPIYEPLRAAVDDLRAEVEGEVEAELELENLLEIAERRIPGRTKKTADDLSASWTVHDGD